jgi:hypothetical protein
MGIGGDFTSIGLSELDAGRAKMDGSFEVGRLDGFYGPR